jgi:hypothetical protein
MLQAPTSESSATADTVSTRVEPRSERPALQPGLSRRNGNMGAGRKAGARLPVGNQAALHLLQSSHAAGALVGPAASRIVLQKKLAVAPANDPAEHEADQVATQVMRMSSPLSLPSPSGTHATGTVQRKCSCQASGVPCPSCREEEKSLLQRKPASAPPAPAVVPSGVTSVLQSPGRPLDPMARAFFEPRFGRDFSAVRIHTDSSAAQSARGLQALAYTSGQHVVFAPGTYSPETASGQLLLAHELTHVLQQNPAGEAGLRSRADGEQRIQRRPDPASDLDQQYQAALAESRQTGNWQETAEVLNGFNRTDIFQRLAQLTPDEVSYLHLGAIGNPCVGPDSQIAQMTAPGVAPASTEGPLASVAAPAKSMAAPAVVRPPATPAPTPIAGMSTTDKVIESIKSAVHQAPDAFGKQVSAMLQPEALAEFAAFTLLFAALQATPAGWVTDLAVIGLEAYLIGPLVFQAVQDLVTFASTASSAHDQKDIDAAGAALADAAGIIGIAMLMKLILHGGSEEPSTSPKGEVEYKPGKVPPADELPVTEKPPAGTEKGPTDAEPRSAETEPNEADRAAPKVREETPSADHKRTLRILEDGECEVCSSPCLDIRNRYSTELENNPDLAGELDDAARLNDPAAQDAEYRRIEQELSKDEAAQEGSGVAHDVGVQLGREAAEADGFDEAHDWVNPLEDRGRYGNGFDDVRVDKADGKYVIVEYKGGSAKLSEGQMERPWVENVIKRMRAAGGNTWADRLENALSTGNLKGVAYSTPIDPVTGAPEATVRIGTWSKY